jgi:cytochrome P450
MTQAPLTPTRTRRQRQVVPLVLELTQRVAARMSASGGVFDITDGAKRITSDVMGHLLYGEVRADAAAGGAGSAAGHSSAEPIRSIDSTPMPLPDALC